MDNIAVRALARILAKPDKRRGKGVSAGKKKVRRGKGVSAGRKRVKR